MYDCWYYDLRVEYNKINVRLCAGRCTLKTGLGLRYANV